MIRSALAVAALAFGATALLAQSDPIAARKALMKTQGNVSRGARVCGLSRRCMTAKMAEYKLDKAVFKEV